MADELVISIDPIGRASALHMDEFPLRFLGNMKLERASYIQFNEDTQLFDVVLPDGTSHISHAQFTGYDEAREFEVEWLQRCKIARVDPGSYSGRALAGSVRRDAGFSF